MQQEHTDPVNFKQGPNIDLTVAKKALEKAWTKIKKDKTFKINHQPFLSGHQE
jgi:hypothetical protein